MTDIEVATTPPYHVVVGNGLMGRLPGLLGPSVAKVMVIHPRALRATGDAVREDLVAAGYEAISTEIPDAEEAKHVQVAAFCWEVLGKSDFTRSDAIVAVGGGAVTDLAGFVAATWLRGIAVVHVPTTVLGMVDAAVGGKTAINTAEGKNLVGSFHQPAGVLADLDSLATLPDNEFFTGMAEVVKAGFIADERILELFESSSLEELRTAPVLTELLERAIAVKARVVADDPKEAGGREILNYGHTLAHAIEREERYQWRHGAAVAVGMMFAAELSRMTKNLPDEVVERQRAILTKLGLPTGYRRDKWPQLLEAMKRDKKARGNLMRFIVLDDVARASVLEGVDTSLLFTAYQEIGEDSPIRTVAL